MRAAHCAPLRSRASTKAPRRRVPRAVALGSSTPYATDQTPVRVLASAVAPRQNVATANVTSVPRDSERRDYLALIPPEKMEV